MKKRLPGYIGEPHVQDALGNTPYQDCGIVTISSVL